MPISEIREIENYFDGAEKYAAHNDTPLIDEIHVEQLYGRISHKISFEKNLRDPMGRERVVLLYGDNGAGKTTVLNLIFHMLSARSNKGHRSRISEIPFRFVRISFADGSHLMAERQTESLKGTFKLSYVGVHHDNESALVKTDARTGIRETEALLEVLKRIEEMHIRPLYLTEKRDFLGDDIANDDYLLEQIGGDEALSRVERYLALSSMRAPVARKDQNLDLRVALARVQRWLQFRAFSGTNSSMASANDSYLDLLQEIANTPRGNSIRHPITEAAIQERLTYLDSDSRKLSRFGLGSGFDANRLHDLLKLAGPANREVLYQVLYTYLGVIQKQMGELAPLAQLLEVFTDALNELFVDKRVEYDAEEGGLKIVGWHQESISPDRLSSGERQLLLLLCNTIIAGQQSRVFLIDEPEISLNIRWQGRLLDILLELTAGSSLQFVIATHSVEMLTTFNSNLWNSYRGA